MIAPHETQRCSAEEWDQLRVLVSNGMLFEVVDWIDAGKPTLRPKDKRTSAFEAAVLAPNLSLTQVLWERAWQEREEVTMAIGRLAWERTSPVLMRYLLEQEDCPVDSVYGDDLCLFHDLALVRLGMARGVRITGENGWASAFKRVGSRPLIRLFIEERDRHPELKRDAVRALCECIAESRQRAVALLVWAGVDPLGKAPEYDDWDDPEDEWSGFPALRLSRAEKAEQLLKQLKLKPTTDQWFDLLEEVAGGRSQIVEGVLALRPDPEAAFRGSPVRSAAMLRRLTRSLCWGWSWFSDHDERLAGFCLRLVEMGVQLAWEDPQEIASFRRYVYGSSRQPQVFRVLSAASRIAEGRSREDLIELVRTAKMRELVIKYDSTILRNLGQRGPADYAAVERKSHAGRRFARSAVFSPPRPEPSLERPEPCVAPTARPSPVEHKPPAGHTLRHAGGRVLTREEIYRDVWTEAARHVAKRYGISGSMLARICTHLNIPRPPRGYWAKPVNSRKGLKPRLPKWRGDGDGTWAINPVNVRAQRKAT